MASEWLVKASSSGEAGWDTGGRGCAGGQPLGYLRGSEEVVTTKCIELDDCS